MYRTIPCDGNCFECRHPDCIANYSATGRTPFEIEQAHIREQKKRDEKAKAAAKAKSDAAFARWLRKNTGRGRKHDDRA